MTLRLAAFQHFCGQVARAGGVWADAFLTARSPLTYERADFLAAFEEANEVHEPAEVKRCWDEDCVRIAGHGDWHMDNSANAWCCAKDFQPPDSPVGVSTSPPTVPPNEPHYHKGDQRPCWCDVTDFPAAVEVAPQPPAAGLDPSPTIIESAPPPPVDGDGPSEEIAAFPRRPSEGQPTVPAGSAPDLPAGISLPMFDAVDLEAIAEEYIEEWTGSEHSTHVAELVVSALLFELQRLAYDQSHPQIPQEQP